jgi:hypothetical protein
MTLIFLQALYSFHGVHMRGLFGPVVFLCAVLLSAIGYLLLHPENGWRQATAAFTAIAARNSAPKPQQSSSAKPTPMPMETPMPMASRTARPERLSAVPEESGSVTIMRLPPTETLRRFPLIPEIRKGTAKSEVLATFGTPDATVTSADRGQLLERLLYRDKSTRKATLIFLVDGNVIGAEAYSQTDSP